MLLSFGISSIAELQIDGGIYDHLAIRTPASGRRRSREQLDITGDSTSDVDDIVASPPRSGWSPRRLHGPRSGCASPPSCPTPAAGSSLGLDTTDFHVQGLVGKTVRSIRFVGNFGLGILGDPTEGANQNDVLDYGFSLARAIREGIEVVGDVTDA
jgi:hypothetical protein